MGDGRWEMGDGRWEVISRKTAIILVSAFNAEVD